MFTQARLVTIPAGRAGRKWHIQGSFESVSRLQGHKRAVWQQMQIYGHLNEGEAGHTQRL